MLATSIFVHAQSSLSDILNQDESLQEATIISIRSALGAKPQTTAVRRSSFLQEIQFYIEIYREMRDTNTLSSIQNRYDAARAELLEPRLPTTMEELISALEML